MPKPVDGPMVVGKERTPERHASDVAWAAHEMILEKYRKGQAEHGGELWRKRGLLDMAIEEALDQIVYLLTLREQLADLGVTPGEISE